MISGVIGGKLLDMKKGSEELEEILETLQRLKSNVPEYYPELEELERKVAALMLHIEVNYEGIWRPLASKELKDEL